MNQDVTYGVARHQRRPEPDFLNRIKSILKTQAELTRRSDLRNEIAKNLLSLGPVCLKKIVSCRAVSIPLSSPSLPMDRRRSRRYVR